MQTKLSRACFIELVGTFGLVFFSSGLVIINQATTPVGQAATSPLTAHQPGIFGIALGQGLILASLLALTVPVSGGYLNPAITLMLWVFKRLQTPQAAGLMAAQLGGSILAALFLRLIFEPGLLQNAHFGAPRINPLAYPTLGQSAQFAGTGVELVLTFFLVFAIFGMAGADSLKLGLTAGTTATPCVLVGLPLTGAALNPVRWLGPTLIAAIGSSDQAQLWRDALAFLAGPILGALLGGAFVFHLYLSGATDGRPGPEDATAIKIKK
jgi:glycerol uptake facilitator-like aquaporin